MINIINLNKTMKFIISERAVEIELTLNITNSINLVDYEEVKSKRKKKSRVYEKGKEEEEIGSGEEKGSLQQ